MEEDFIPKTNRQILDELQRAVGGGAVENDNIVELRNRIHKVDLLDNISLEPDDLLSDAIEYAYGAAENIRLIEENHGDSDVLQTLHFKMLKQAIWSIIDLEEEQERKKNATTS